MAYPWRLQGCMRHKRIEETMLYVHVADNHRREIPEDILAAAAGERDPDTRIVKLLGARGGHAAAKLGTLVEFPVILTSTSISARQYDFSFVHANPLPTAAIF